MREAEVRAWRQLGSRGCSSKPDFLPAGDGQVDDTPASRRQKAVARTSPRRRRPDETSKLGLTSTFAGMTMTAGGERAPLDGGSGGGGGAETECEGRARLDSVHLATVRAVSRLLQGENFEYNQWARDHAPLRARLLHHRRTRKRGPRPITCHSKREGRLGNRSCKTRSPPRPDRHPTPPRLRPARPSPRAYLRLPAGCGAVRGDGAGGPLRGAAERAPAHAPRPTAQRAGPSKRLLVFAARALNTMRESWSTLSLR